MTIKPFIAAVAAVSSSVLFLAHPAHAQSPNFAGYPQNMGPQNQMTMPTPPAMPSMPAAPQMPTMPSMPAAPQQPAVPSFAAPQQAPAQPAPAPAAAPAKPAADTSNTYVKGQCTWYVKSKRPDLPNRLGNGGQWVKNAAARGFSTGKTPRVGAVAEQPGHVAYVEAVNANGTVKISEMNYNGGVGVVHERTVAASKFTYIYINS